MYKKAYKTEQYAKQEIEEQSSFRTGRTTFFCMSQIIQKNGKWGENYI